MRLFFTSFSEFLGGENSPVVKGLRVTESAIISEVNSNTLEGICQERVTCSTSSSKSPAIEPPLPRVQLRETNSSSELPGTEQPPNRRRKWSEIEQEKGELEIKFLKLRNRNLLLQNKKLVLQIQALERAQ